MKKRPTADDVLNLIQMPGPQPAAPEINEGPRLIEVTQIRPFEGNPRLGRNPQYEEIEASIREVGCEQPIVVTRRPGETHYTVWGGGNTRLEIMQRLYAETGDDKYRYMRCYERPWTTEADAVAAHLKENDLRGNLSLIERALAVDRLRQMLEEEAGRSLSQRELAQALQARGYRVVRQRLTLYQYVVDQLYPAIPEALKAGMGIAQVEALRRLERAFRAAWRLLEIDGGDDTAAGEIFRALLERRDPHIDPETLRPDLEAELWTAVDEGWGAGELGLLLGYLLEGRDEEELRQWLVERAQEEAPALPGAGEDESGTEAPATGASAPDAPRPTAPTAPDTSGMPAGAVEATRGSPEQAGGGAPIQGTASAPPAPEPAPAPAAHAASVEPIAAPDTPSIQEAFGEWPLAPTDADMHVLPPPEIARRQSLERLSIAGLRERAWRLARRLSGTLDMMLYYHTDAPWLAYRTILRSHWGMGFGVAPVHPEQLHIHVYSLFEEEITEVRAHLVYRQYLALWGWLVGLSEQFRSAINWESARRNINETGINYVYLAKESNYFASLWGDAKMWIADPASVRQTDPLYVYLIHRDRRNEPRGERFHKYCGVPATLFDFGHVLDWDQHDWFHTMAEQDFPIPSWDDMVALMDTVRAIHRDPKSYGRIWPKIKPMSEEELLAFNEAESILPPREVAREVGKLHERARSLVRRPFDPWAWGKWFVENLKPIL